MEDENDEVGKGVFRVRYDGRFLRGCLRGKYDRSSGEYSGNRWAVVIARAYRVGDLRDRGVRVEKRGGKTMKRLIDLDEALRGLDGMFPAEQKDEYQKGIAVGLALARVRLLSLQTVEVEEQEVQDDSD